MFADIIYCESETMTLKCMMAQCHYKKQNERVDVIAVSKKGRFKSLSNNQ